MAGRPGSQWKASLPSHDKCGDVWTAAVSADGKSPEELKKHPLHKNLFSKIGGKQRSLPGAQAPLARSLELLGGPSYLRKTPKINFRDTSLYKKVGGLRGA